MQIKKNTIITLLLILSSIVIHQTFAATSDTATGSFTINAAPSITTAPQFVDSSYALSSILTPDDTAIFGINVTIDHSSQMSDLKNVTFYVFDDSVHGSDYNSATPDGLLLTKITWVESTDTWSIDQGSLNEWTMQTPIDPGSAASDTSFEFVARFDISRAARYDTDWNTTVVVYDDDATPESDSAAESGLVTMQEFLEVSFPTSTFSWSTAVQPNSVNNTHGALTVEIRSNRQWELRISSTDFSANAETDVDIEANNIIAWDEDGSVGSTSMWIRNTAATALGTWDNQSPMSDENVITRNVYIFLSTGTFFVAGKSWSCTVTVLIQANV